MMAQASAGVDDDEQAADLGKLEEIDQMLADGLPKAPPREHPDLDDDLLQAHKRQRPEAAQAVRARAPAWGRACAAAAAGAAANSADKPACTKGST